MIKAIDIIILCAVRNEYKAAKSILNLDCRNAGILEGFISTEGRLNNSSCLIILMGVGGKRSKLCIQETLKIYKPSQVIVFGAAGAINPNLKIGVVTAPSVIINYKLPYLELEGNKMNTKVNKIKHKSSINNIVITKAGTCERFIGSKKLRQSILNKLQLDTTDCETYYIACICEKMCIPFIAFRCITDSADNKAIFHYLFKAQKILNSGAQIVKEVLSME